MRNRAQLAKTKPAKAKSSVKNPRQSPDRVPDQNVKGGEKMVEFNGEVGPLSLADYLWRNRQG